MNNYVTFRIHISLFRCIRIHKDVRLPNCYNEQEHAKGFQTLNDEEMYEEFISVNPELAETVSGSSFRRFKPWWIYPPIQE